MKGSRKELSIDVSGNLRQAMLDLLLQKRRKQGESVKKRSNLHPNIQRIELPGKGWEGGGDPIGKTNHDLLQVIYF